MKLTLNISNKNDRTFIFKFMFENDSRFETILPVTSFCNSVDRMGIFILENDVAVEPIEVYVYKIKDEIKDNVTLSPYEIYTVELTGNLTLIQDKYWALVFKNATYIVKPLIHYNIYIHWGIFKSNSIDWHFCAPKP